MTTMRNRLTPVLIGIIAVLAVYMAVIRPAFSLYTGIEKKITQKERQLIRDRRALRERDENRRDIGQYAGQLLLHSSVSDDQAQALFLKDVEGMLIGAHVAIADMKVLPVMKRDDGKQLFVQAEFETPIETLTDLLYTIARADDLTVLDSFSIERKNAQSQTLVVRGVFSKVVMTP